MDWDIKYVRDMDELSYAYDDDAGADVPLHSDITVVHGKNKIPLGFVLAPPRGVAGFIFPRSSVMGDGIEYSVAPVDPNYSGEWHFIFYNPGDPFVLKKGERFCQIFFTSFLHVDKIKSRKPDQKRGDNGLGSSGR